MPLNKEAELNQFFLNLFLRESSLKKIFFSLMYQLKPLFLIKKQTNQNKTKKKTQLL